LIPTVWGQIFSPVTLEVHGSQHILHSSTLGYAAVNVNSVPPWSGVDANSTSNWVEMLRSQILFHRRFSGKPTQIMRCKFVEYLGSDCFHFCRIPVE
jgi:hypothetical protein